MPRLPTITSAQMLRALRRDGWNVVGLAGSHAQLTHASKLGKVTVPVHRGDLKPGTLASILKQATLTVDELRRLL